MILVLFLPLIHCVTRSNILADLGWITSLYKTRRPFSKSSIVLTGFFGLYPGVDTESPISFAVMEDKTSILSLIIAFSMGLVAASNSAFNSSISGNSSLTLTTVFLDCITWSISRTLASMLLILASVLGDPVLA